MLLVLITLRLLLGIQVVVVGISRWEGMKTWVGGYLLRRLEIRRLMQESSRWSMIELEVEGASPRRRHSRPDLTAVK